MAEMKLSLASTDFTHGGPISARHTCDGSNVSPELHWMHPPEETRSFALILDDPDAPSGLFTHWVLFDIPASVRSLAEGEGGVGVSGRNDFQQVGYGGPCPPPNRGKHRYFFTLYALDVDSLRQQSGASRQEVEAAMEGHVLRQAQLMGLYERRPG
jgi:Raf kinase inhibitor-like YbhB/YbcL family protein